MDGRPGPTTSKGRERLPTCRDTRTNAPLKNRPKLALDAKAKECYKVIESEKRLTKRNLLRKGRDFVCDCFMGLLMAFVALGGIMDLVVFRRQDILDVFMLRRLITGSLHV